VDAATQYALAYALTTTAGLRGFVTLFVASLAVHLGWIHPGASFAWLGADGTTIVLGVFAVVEVLADKFPVVDHALHAVSLAVRPVAAAILVGATMHTDGWGSLAALMAVGALNALVVHGSVSAARAASTVTTMGAGNTALSVGEDAVTGVALVLAFLQPYVAAAACLALVIALLFAARWAIARARTAQSPRDRT